MSDVHPRLFLISPVLDSADIFLESLKAALEGGRIDCLLLRFASKESQELKQMIQMLAPLAQASGAAVMIETVPDQRFAARVGVDGVHVHYSSEDFADAIEAHHPDRIVGAGQLKSRDDAMMAGEMGADYVMFGEPYPDGVLPDFKGVLERASWWAEVFSTPCVAYTPSLQNIDALAKARVEFIALESAVWQADMGATKAVATALQMITTGMSV